ncbi:AraC family transcriptional regulator [Paenibacillus swuensis]|uniref:AraC family transcriptional regulator n=1 Tax=Paenibacillus swuensis TaxID=1178515 RepID=A0A172TNC8_9BACL|nr:response regulator [Paenibacillus swuensis]ANE48394.1 AraC family transcriptional regulator [Paenibacillus swuensis]
MYHILIVDDEPLICKGLSSLLATSGFDIEHIHTAYNAYEALDVLKMEEIDLLITDIQMGEINGIELMHQAKMIKPWVQTIIISAHETFQYAQMALRLGAKDYLIKPLNSRQLLDSVRNVLLKMEKPARAQEDLLTELQEHFRMEEPDPKKTEGFNRLISDPEQQLPALRQLADLGVALQGPYFSVVRIRLRLEERSEVRTLSASDARLLEYAALNILHELLNREWRHAAFSSSDHVLSIILEWEEAQVEDANVNKINLLDMLGRSIHHHIRKYLGLTSVIGISQIVKGTDGLPMLAEQAEKAMRWNKKHKDHDVFYYGDFNWEGEAQDPSEEEFHAQNNDLIDKARAYIDQHYAQKGLTLQEVAQKNHISPNYLSYLFKKNTGFNLWEYVIKLRMEESKKLLLQTDMRRYEIAEKVGYESPEHFSKIFKKFYGISPSELKK